MRLPVLMFDFGNVVGYFDYLKTYNRFGDRLGVPGAVVRETLEAKGMTALLHQFELGALSPPDFARITIGLLELEISFDDFARDWEDIFELNEPVADLLGFLKGRGYTLLLGSNTNILHATFYRSKCSAALDHFDHFVFSYEVGRMKPHQAFFDAALRAVGAQAGSCVFIDDAEPNVEGARAAGLVGIHYQNTPGLIADLARLGVEVPPTQA